MRKILLIILSVLALNLMGLGQVWADSLNIRIASPKSPSNQTGYNITFVTSSNGSDTITVDCLVQKPGEGSFNNFASGVNLPASGGTGTCSTSGVFNDAGSYNFKVVAHAGGETVEDSASVDYSFSGPETPTDYSKNRSSSCQYQINFHTANDSGKTVKVEIYRSENASFTADSGTKAGEVGIGSNADGSFTDSIPDCNKNYYYVIRAFDASGNGSGLRGDSNTVTIAASPSPVSGAIAVSAGTGGAGEILGEQASPTPEATAGGQVEGAATIPADQAGPLGGLLNFKNILLAIGVILVLGLAYYTYRQTRE